MIDDEKGEETPEKDELVSDEPSISQVEAFPELEPPVQVQEGDAGKNDNEGVAPADLEPEEESEQDATEDSDLEQEDVDLREVDDPLAPAYDLEGGAQFDSFEESPSGLPFQSKIESAKEFFSTEVLYRFDIIEPQELEPIKGSYRIELTGENGGVWSLKIGDQLEVSNSKEEADTILAMRETDFLEVVNGKLNPQLSILSQKIKVTGAVKQAIRLQEILAPRPE
jgi:hypothetical protein